MTFPWPLAVAAWVRAVSLLDHGAVLSYYDHGVLECRAERCLNHVLMAVTAVVSREVYYNDHVREAAVLLLRLDDW